MTNVRVYSGSSTSSKISIWIAVKKGKVVSVSRGKGDWIITIRTRGQVSTYVVSENPSRSLAKNPRLYK